VGTRGNVGVQDRGKNLVRIYRQFDTYLSGMGADLVEFFGYEPKIVNGFGSEERGKQTVFNGMGCLAAALIAHLKDGIGNVYIEAVDSEPDGLFIEYVYTLYESEVEQPKDNGFSHRPGELQIKVESIGGESYTTEEGRTQYHYHTIYDGPFKDFDPIALEKQGREED
jgi:hypothetical protein